MSSTNLIKILKKENFTLKVKVMSCFKINLIQENFVNYLVVVKCIDHYKHLTTIFHLRENPSFHSSLCAYFSVTILESSVNSSIFSLELKEICPGIAPNFIYLAKTFIKAEINVFTHL